MPGVDIVPTFKTRNERMCLLLPDGRLGYLLTRDAERLQARCWPLFAVLKQTCSWAACTALPHACGMLLCI